MSFLSRIMVVKSKAHFNAGGNNNRSAGAGGQSFEGTRKRSGSQARSRVAVMICCFGVAYAVIGGRLVQYGMASPETVSSTVRLGFWPWHQVISSRTGCARE